MHPSRTVNRKKLLQLHKYNCILGEIVMKNIIKKYHKMIVEKFVLMLQNYGFGENVDEKSDIKTRKI